MHSLPLDGRDNHDGSSQNIRRAGWDPRDVAGKQNYTCQQMKHRKALDGVGIPGTLLGDTNIKEPAEEALRNPCWLNNIEMERDVLATARLAWHAGHFV